MTTLVTMAGQPSANARSAASAGGPPKKKRKRTGTGGASDDCFTCSTRGVKCDRKRPYCTQCIDIGKECSGYKTTLTWGVGVASRGKLRGLSCPIANKNADGTDVSPVEMEERRQRRKSSVSQSKKGDSSAKASASRAAAEAPTINSTSTLQIDPAISIGYANITGSVGGLQQSPIQWQPSAYEDQLYNRRSESMRSELAPLQPLQTNMDPPMDSLQPSKSARSAYSDSVFYSPMDYSQTPASALPYPESFKQSVPGSYATPVTTGASTDNAEIESFLDRLQSTVDPTLTGTMLTPNGQMSDQLSLGAFEHGLLSSEPAPLTPTSVPAFDILGDTIKPEDEHEHQDSKDLVLVDTRFSSPFFNISPRLQTLMDYYDRNICPYLVAFDNTENPYRRHILQLAFRNEGLQHAIAALATNNHRMRTKELRQVEYVGELGEAFDHTSVYDPSGPTQEESIYKQMSIDQLNLQLSDPHAAQDDSVLATLLILCLFHVCDSGFSKFKTQLAGVQKLLSMRQPNTQSDFTRWVEMFFTWFDVMTSTVNDREVQIKGESLAMLDFNANLGALEQFSGCDGRLFKLIARLGRLNVLAQGKPVRNMNGANSRPNAQRPLMWWKKRPSRRLGSLVASDYDNIDGNGWGTPILSSDEDADGSADEEILVNDERHDFWTEWRDIRNRLEAWRMHNTSDFTDGITGQEDMRHINELFRFAALLYTERLGSPLLPSSHRQFQDLVSSALHHLSSLQVTSCVNKFLLWPLFIIGTECVDEEHRRIIRTRCRDLSEESGFYNNMSSLYVLERVWKEVGSNVRGMEADEVKARRRDSEASKPGRYGQAFRWRKAMDRVDGEYIVI